MKTLIFGVVILIALYFIGIRSFNKWLLSKMGGVLIFLLKPPIRSS
jgi:hypothetical protein